MSITVHSRAGSWGQRRWCSLIELGNGLKGEQGLYLSTYTDSQNHCEVGTMQAELPVSSCKHLGHLSLLLLQVN